MDLGLGSGCREFVPVRRRLAAAMLAESTACPLALDPISTCTLWRACEDTDADRRCLRTQVYEVSTEGLLYGRGLLLVKDDAPRRRTIAVLHLDGQPHERGRLLWMALMLQRYSNIMTPFRSSSM